MVSLWLLGGAVLVAAAAAALVFWLVVWPWRRPPARQSSAGWVLGMGAGIYAGCIFAGLLPRWPPTEDRHRFLVVLLPIVLVVELTALFLPARWQAWLPRLGVAFAAAPILLYRTTYLADLSGPGSAEWSRAQAALILCTLAALLSGTWCLASRLQNQIGEQAISPLLGLTCLAAGVAVMLSGYYRGGLFGLPLAGALVGATLASRFARRQQIAAEGKPHVSASDGALGIAFVGLFAILLVGRFFGSLPTSFAVVIYFAPLLAWIAELPALRKLHPGLRNAIRILVVALPLVVVVVLAQGKFAKAWKAKSTPTPAATPHRSGSG